MTAASVIQTQNAVPFQPYRLMLADRREILIDHPDFATISEEDDSITVLDVAGGVEIVDLAMVVSLKQDATPP